MKKRVEVLAWGIIDSSGKLRDVIVGLSKKRITNDIDNYFGEKIVRVKITEVK